MKIRDGRAYLPIRGYVFDRPLVLFQSDDWGLVGVRDRAGWEELSAGGLTLGTHPYDYHSLETAEDLSALYRVLRQHHDSLGRYPSFVFNFIVANVDFARTRAANFQTVKLLALADGLPEGWRREGLTAAYREGIEFGLVQPGLHGLTHFCLAVAQRTIGSDTPRGELLRTLYRAGTSVLYGHARWLSYEYWDDVGETSGAWLDAGTQCQLVQQASLDFERLFQIAPITACAPGYRANVDTRHAYMQGGVRVAQNGPGLSLLPHWEQHGLMMLYRNVSLEAGNDPIKYSVKTAMAQAEQAIRRGCPVIVSIHAVNFHSTLRNNRQRTLEHLNTFLTELEQRYPDLVYTHDAELLDVILHGTMNASGHPTAISRRTRWQPSVAWASRLARRQALM